jgi:hypothetical protein
MPNLCKLKNFFFCMEHFFLRYVVHILAEDGNFFLL